MFATLEPNFQVGLLREAFEDSNLPFRVDLFIWGEVLEVFDGGLSRYTRRLCSA